MRVHWCGLCVRFFQAFGGDPHCPRCGGKATDAR